MGTVDDEDISIRHFVRQNPNSEGGYKACETFRVMAGSNLTDILTMKYNVSHVLWILMVLHKLVVHKYINE